MSCKFNSESEGISLRHKLVHIRYEYIVASAKLLERLLGIFAKKSLDAGHRGHWFVERHKVCVFVGSARPIGYRVALSLLI